MVAPVERAVRGDHTKSEVVDSVHRSTRTPCTVRVDGVPTRACTVPVSATANRSVTTIEGLSEARDHPVQAAWIEEQVPQCGYCQSGMVMAAAALLENNPNPTDDDIDRAINNICRCGTYTRIRRAIHSAARKPRS